MNKDSTEIRYSLVELCALAGVAVRTARFYIQSGLVDRPHGETRAAHYTTAHLEQLLQVRKWSEAGVSLERIRDLLHGSPPPVAARIQPKPGTVQVLSHVLIADGMELVIDPGLLGLDPSQLRAFVRESIALFERIAQQENHTEAKGETDE